MTVWFLSPPVLLQYDSSPHLYYCSMIPLPTCITAVWFLSPPVLLPKWKALKCQTLGAAVQVILVCACSDNQAARANQGRGGRSHVGGGRLIEGPGWATQRGQRPTSHRLAAWSWVGLEQRWTWIHSPFVHGALNRLNLVEVSQCWLCIF